MTHISLQNARLCLKATSNSHVIVPEICTFKGCVSPDSFTLLMPLGGGAGVQHQNAYGIHFFYIRTSKNGLRLKCS